MKTRILSCTLVGLAFAGWAAGCSSDSQSDRYERGPYDQQPLAQGKPQIAIVSGNSDVITGDTTTLTVTSHNTVGRDLKLKWTTTGGKLTTQEDGRVARVRFDAPGVYTVTAKLVKGDTVEYQDSVTISARPLH